MVGFLKNFSFDVFFRKIGVDIGSSRIRIWTEGGGVVVDEPTCLAVEIPTQKVIAVGSEALKMQGRVGDQIEIFYPIEHGAVTDPEVLVALLRVLFQRVIDPSYILRPTMMVSLSSQLDSVNREAIVALLYQAGAREVYTISQPLAAAIGSGVPIADASGTFLLQMGGGVTEAAVISLGSIVVAETDIRAGKELDQAIVRYVLRHHELKISLGVAQRLKHSVCSVVDREAELLISGQDMTSSAPREVVLTAEDLKPALDPVVERYALLLKRLLEKVPPELTADVIDKGMLLSGGLAQLHGFERYLVETLGIPVSVVEQPELAVIKGVGTALQHLELFKESLGYQN